MLAPAATLITQHAAHAVADQNGEDGLLNLGIQNGFDSDFIFQGDNITLFSDQNFKSASDVDTSDFGDFDLFDLLVEKRNED